VKFSYKAIKKNGETYESEREATDKFDLFRQLKKEGETIISYNEAGHKSGMSMNLQLPSFLNRISTQEKITIARNLGGMLEAGLALSRALQVIEHQSKNKKLKMVLTSVNKSISEGTSFHDSLQKFPEVFSTLFISMVKAGEESGNLAPSLKQIADQMEKTYLIQKKVKGAMIYPGIILSLMFVIGIVMLTFVVPRLTATFTDLHANLPASTKFVIALSDFFKNHYVIAFLIFAAIVAGFYYGMKTAAGKRAFAFGTLRLPVVGVIIKETNSARTARTLSSLLMAGVDLVLAIRITGEVVQNVFYKNVLKDAEAAVQKGRPLSEIFIANEFLYPIFVGEMVSVGEETGRISNMLEGVASYYENEVEQKTKDMSTIIEPVLMIIIGVAVGFFAISMISPMYSVMNNV
jgi:type IV pilus assembly protein PilC